MLEVSGKEDREEGLTEEARCRRFKQVNQRSACGPDEVPGAVLKHCPDSLAPVFMRLFQMALDSDHIPAIGKSSHVVPVPKEPSPSVLSDHHPVVLMSVLILLS